VLVVLKSEDMPGSVSLDHPLTDGTDETVGRRLIARPSGRSPHFASVADCLVFAQASSLVWNKMVEQARFVKLALSRLTGWIWHPRSLE
jgi:hypothetical protein